MRCYYCSILYLHHHDAGDICIHSYNNANTSVLVKSYLSLIICMMVGMFKIQNDIIWLPLLLLVARSVQCSAVQFSILILLLLVKVTKYNTVTIIILLLTYRHDILSELLLT